MPTKHDKYYQLMRQTNQELFDMFATFTAGDLTDPKRAKEFEEVGLEILDTVRFWERKLCSGMERGRHAQYSNQLADKFWQQVRSDYPLIDQVGVKKVVN